MQVCQGLWDSYEEDAFPRDRATRTFLDPSKQHALRHQGDHFQVVGPLNVSRSPQGQPVIFQAGDSDQGRDLGATIGEGIFTHSPTIEQAQAFYTDLKGRAVAKGRDPDHIVIMPGAPVFVGDTDDEAREIEHDLQTGDKDFDRALAELGRPFAWHDFRQYDLDAPFPQEALVYAERGFRTGAEKIARLAKDNDFTLRQPVEFISAPRKTPFAGSPATSPPVSRSGSTPAPSTASTTASATPASGAASARRSSRFSRSAASSVRNTSRRRCAATWASPSRKTATQGQEQQSYPERRAPTLTAPFLQQAAQPGDRT